jgi:hypothetical protein
MRTLLFLLLLFISFNLQAQPPAGIIAASTNYRGGTPTPPGTPVNNTSSSIAGLNEVGHFLTATPGDWTGADAVTAQWKRNGVAIPYQSGLKYLLENEDETAVITYVETATNDEGSTEQASNDITVNDLLVYWLNTANLNTMIKESYVGTNADSPVTTDGDVVGSLNSLGYGAIPTRISANTSQPVLGSDAVINSFVTFTSTARPYVCTSGLIDYFSPLHDVSPVWSVEFYVKTATDGTLLELFNNKTGASSTPGVRVFKSTGNKLSIQLGDGSSLVLSFASTTNILTANGWHAVTLQMNGTGAGNGELKIKNSSGSVNTSETFTVPTGTNTASSVTLSVAGQNLSLAHFKLRNRVLTTDEKDEYLNFTYNPARSSTEYLIKRWELDFSNESYEDLALTDHCDDGDPIRAVKNDLYTSPFGAINRTCESASEAESPIFSEGGFGGDTNTADWNGDDIKEFILSRNLFPERSGRWLQTVIGLNNDRNFGSHTDRDGNYMVWTGPDYAGAIGPDYVTIHDNTGGSPGSLALANPNNSRNIVMASRQAGTLNLYTGDATTASGSISNPYEIGSIGKRWSALSSDWAMDGKQVLQVVWMGVPDATWLTEQINRYNDIYMQEKTYVPFPDAPTLSDTHTLVQATTGTGLQIGDLGGKQNFRIQWNYDFAQFNVVNADNYAMISYDTTSPATWSVIGIPPPQDYCIDVINAAHGLSLYRVRIEGGDNQIKWRPFDSTLTVPPIVFENNIHRNSGFAGISLNQSIVGTVYGKVTASFLSFTGSGAERLYWGNTGNSNTKFNDTTRVTHMYSDSSGREVVQLNNHKYVMVSNVTGRHVGIVLETPDQGIGQKNFMQCQGCGAGYIKNSIGESVAPMMIASTGLDLLNNRITWSQTDRPIYLQDVNGNGYAYKNMGDDTVRIDGNDFICAGFTLDHVFRIQEDDFIVVITNNRFPPSATSVYTCDGPCPTIIMSGNTFDSDSVPPVTFGPHPDPAYADFWEVVTSDYDYYLGRGALTPEP